VKHKHVGPIDQACTNCYVEARMFVESEQRRQRFWACALVGFAFLLAAVAAGVLWKLGRMD
jgi:hypothetical protein